MIVLNPESKCTGCAACAQACPKNCIRMLQDAEGFSRPVVDDSVCVNCGMCQRVCPVIHPMVRCEMPDAYAAKCTDEAVRSVSSSGGVFTLLAEALLEQGGVVFGAGFDSQFSVAHVKVESKEDIARLQGSKYVQSDVGNTYREVKELLDNGRMVYYSGTPCQIQGLLSYLRKPYDGLITQDIICHGVPSPMVWKKYLDDQKRRLKTEFVDVSFRDKSLGWRRYSIRISLKNGCKYRAVHSEDLYMRSFTMDMCLRPSCHECSFKTLQRASDLTLADFWGIQHFHQEMDDDRGVSLIFVNSAKGSALLERAAHKMLLKPTDPIAAVKYNGAMICSTQRPPQRDVYMDAVQNMGFRKATERYCARPTLLKKVINKLKRLITKLLRRR